MSWIICVNSAMFIFIRSWIIYKGHGLLLHNVHSDIDISLLHPITDDSLARHTTAGIAFHEFLLGYRHGRKEIAPVTYLYHAFLPTEIALPLVAVLEDNAAGLQGALQVLTREKCELRVGRDTLSNLAGRVLHSHLNLGPAAKALDPNNNGREIVGGREGSEGVHGVVEISALANLCLSLVGGG